MTFSLRFAKIAPVHNDADICDQCEREAEQLKRKTLINMLGWRMVTKRAWFDDGTPLGTSSAEGLQNWTLFSRADSVLSGLGEARVRIKRWTAYKNLDRRKSRNYQFGWNPPFAIESLPGTISKDMSRSKENGGQYTCCKIYRRYYYGFCQIGRFNNVVWELWYD